MNFSRRVITGWISILCLISNILHAASTPYSKIEDNTESISNVMGSSGSSGLFANCKRKQDESSNEDPEMNKLRRFEH